MRLPCRQRVLRRDLGRQPALPPPTQPRPAYEDAGSATESAAFACVGPRPNWNAARRSRRCRAPATPVARFSVAAGGMGERVGPMGYSARKGLRRRQATLHGIACAPSLSGGRGAKCLGFRGHAAIACQCPDCASPGAFAVRTRRQIPGSRQVLTPRLRDRLAAEAEHVQRAETMANLKLCVRGHLILALGRYDRMPSR